MRTFQPKGSVTFNDGFALHAAVLASFGLGQIHDYHVEAETAAGLLVTVLVEIKPETDVISIASPQSRHLSLRVSALVDFLVEQKEGTVILESGCR